ncbi:MAG: CZB domain-containing protein [Elusimicrobia bacterium]|nr:CZB domain-containing protein [Elusimicrobiota bacterium]
MDNIKVRLKLTLSFLGVISIFIVAGYIQLKSLNDLSGNIKVGSECNSLAQEFLGREIDHLDWLSKAGAFLGNPQVTTVEVQKDHRLCKFGKWYYGEGRGKAEQSLPQLAARLASIEAPHKKLHESAVTLESKLASGDRTGATAFFYGDMESHKTAIRRELAAVRGIILNEAESQKMKVHEHATETRNVAVLSWIRFSCRPSLQPFRRAQNFASVGRTDTDCKKDRGRDNSRFHIQLWTKRNGRFGPVFSKGG